MQQDDPEGFGRSMTESEKQVGAIRRPTEPLPLQPKCAKKNVEAAGYHQEEDDYFKSGRGRTQEPKQSVRMNTHQFMAPDPQEEPETPEEEDASVGGITVEE